MYSSSTQDRARSSQQRTEHISWFFMGCPQRSGFTATTLTQDEKGGREGLLAFADVTKEASSHFKIKCKTCPDKNACTKEGMAWPTLPCRRS